MLIAGFDEVGRGAWAGPLMVAGVVLDDERDYNFRDSKHYSPAVRQRVLSEIYQAADAMTLVSISALDIDKVGLAAALERAFTQAAHELRVSPARYIVYGSKDYLEFDNSVAEVKADDTYPSVAAASIVAKVHRDQFMKRAAQVDTRYGYERHVGYGTALHKQQLQTHGPTSLHRLSFKPIQALS